MLPRLSSSPLRSQTITTKAQTTMSKSAVQSPTVATTSCCAPGCAAPLLSAAKHAVAWLRTRGISWSPAVWVLLVWAVVRLLPMRLRRCCSPSYRLRRWHCRHCRCHQPPPRVACCRWRSGRCRSCCAWSSGRSSSPRQRRAHPPDAPSCTCRRQGDWRRFGTCTRGTTRDREQQERLTLRLRAPLRSRRLPRAPSCARASPVCLGAASWSQTPTTPPPPPHR